MGHCLDNEQECDDNGNRFSPVTVGQLKDGAGSGMEVSGRDEPGSEWALTVVRGKLGEDQRNAVEPLICRPVAVWHPDDLVCDEEVVEGESGWNAFPQMDLIMGGEEDQRKVSEWVRRRLRSFSKFMGVVCKGFDGELSALFSAIEDR